jgi:hypothetical protein
VVPTGGQASTMDVTSKLPEPVCGLQEGTPAEDGIPIGGVRWNGWTPEALESLRADVDQQELERLELLAKVKEQQEETAYWCEQAVKLAIRLVDLQTERAADMERWAQQLEEIGMLLSRAGFAVREERRPLVLEPDLLEEAVNGLTGERLLIARDVVW